MIRAVATQAAASSAASVLGLECPDRCRRFRRVARRTTRRLSAKQFAERGQLVAVGRPGHAPSQRQRKPLVDRRRPRRTAAAGPWPARLRRTTSLLSVASACSGVFDVRRSMQVVFESGQSNVVRFGMRRGALEERVHPAAIAILALAVRSI